MAFYSLLVDKNNQTATPTPTKKQLRKSWRDVLLVHPAAELFPRMAADELVALGEDVKKNGLMTSPALWRASMDDERIYLLDGRNRFDAMEAVGLSVLDEDAQSLDSGIAERCLVLRGDNGDDPYTYVTSLNLHRRNLTTEQKREVIANLLRAQPEKSDRQVAKMAKVDHKTVGVVRREQEGVGNVPHVERRTDTRGRKQPAKKATTKGQKQPSQTSKANKSSVKSDAGKKEWDRFCAAFDAWADLNEKYQKQFVTRMLDREKTNQSVVDHIEACLRELGWSRG